MNNLTSMQLISDVMRVGIDFIYRFDSLVISFFSSLCFIHTELSRAVVSLNCVSTRDLSRDDWIKKFIKRKRVLGWFGQSGLQRKKLPTAISMQLFAVVFSTFCGQKKMETL